MVHQEQSAEEMDERSGHRLARIQPHLQSGKLDFMPTLGIGQPALDLATAFPQATPASIFPPSGELSFPPCANIMYGIEFLKPLLLLKLVSTFF
jgi:hypothetical protein